MTLTITVSHDTDEGVWYVERSDVPGLNAEAGSLDALVEIISDLVPDLIAANLPDHASQAGRVDVCVQDMVETRRNRVAQMGSNLYPAPVRLLMAAGCQLVRQGKGSHEIWFSPLTGRRFTVPRNTVKPHTANSALRDAGLPKAF